LAIDVARDIGLFAVRGPCLHELAPSFQRIAAPIAGLARRRLVARANIAWPVRKRRMQIMASLLGIQTAAVNGFMYFLRK
jgi:hypothetical protein